ncbi:MAG: hypothetical protein DMF81_07210 [Acidobacteria bacterium]|nr:MAG: hypothetical protein DMF81_07210 [Acidobacteriota bacterium]
MAAGATLDQARAARQAALDRLAADRGGTLRVNLARTKDGGWALKVNLEAAAPAGTALPEEISGVPVRYEVVGRVRARTARRPF